jgi:zinc finger-containing ubiquitin peptidase 1
MTIIGFEKKKDGTANILVFDPMFHDSSDVVQLIGENFSHKSPAVLLKAYQRPMRYLRKYNEFEVLK